MEILNNYVKLGLVIVCLIWIGSLNNTKKRWTCNKCNASWPEQEKNYADAHTLYHAGHDTALR